MDCRLFERLVQLNMDGLLSAKEREDMLRHAQTCPSCAALLQDMTELAALLSTRLRAVEPPTGFAQAGMAALPESPVKLVARARIKRRPVWRRWGLTVAAALLLAVGLSTLWPSKDIYKPPLDEPEPRIIAAYQDPEAPLNPLPFDSDNLTETDPEIEPSTNTVIEEEDPGIIGEPEEITVKIEDPQPKGNPGNVTDNPETELPEEVTNTEEPWENGVDLPIPTTELPPTNGMFSLTVLAAYEDCDAILPSLNEDGLVEFYTKYKNQIHKWTQALGSEEEPKHKEQVKILPTLPEIMGSVEESAAAGFSYVSALSPDNRFTVVNRSGEQPGIWLYTNTATNAEAEEAVEKQGTALSALGGGKVLCWSSDSNKLLYTDSTGKLFVYYIYEQNVLPLYSGMVTCATWAGDNKTVVFSGKLEKNTRSVIYSIIVP
jgi:hypothetical protein